MASIAPTPKLQFLDNAGNPLVGGKLYTYAAGTTTPLATYTNAGGLTSNANPVILDSRGEADVWLGTSQYKFKLTTSTDVEVWTVDNLNAADAVTLAAALSGAAAAMAASNGSSLVGFIQPGTGAVATTVQTKLRERVSVKDFGAVGDGVTDDTVAIRAALQSFTSSTGGGSIYFPPGTYIISSSLIVDVNGMTLIGVKGQSWLKRKNSVAGDTMNVMQTAWQGRYGSAPIYDFTVIGLGFDGNKANNIAGVNDNYDHCLSLLYSNRTTLRDCIIKNANRIGAPLSTGANDSTVEGCWFLNCDEGGVYAEVSNNIRFVNNHVYGCSNASYNIGSICFNNITGGVISGNIVDGNGSTAGRDGIYIRNVCTDIAVSGNTVRNQFRYGIWVYDESNMGGASSPSRISITGNTVKGTGNHPIFLQYARQSSIVGNTIDCGTTLPTGVYFHNCTDLSISANQVNNLSTSVTTGTISAGSNSLTITSSTWFPNSVTNAYVYIANAGSGGNTPLFAQITAGGGTTTLTLDRYAAATATTQAVTFIPVTRGAGCSGIKISDVSGTFSPIPYGQTTAGTFAGTSSGTWTMTGDRIQFSSLVVQTTLIGAAGILQVSLPMKSTGSSIETFPSTVANTTYTGMVTAIAGYNTGAGYAPGNVYYRIGVSNGGTLSLFSAPTGTMTAYVSGQYQLG